LDRSKINIPATLNEVERILQQARYYKFYGSIKREIRTTMGYEPRYYGKTNAVARPVEELVEFNDEHEARQKAILDSVMLALSGLAENEAKVIESLYLKRERPKIQRLADELFVSYSSVNRILQKAKLTIADLMGLEVYVQE